MKIKRRIASPLAVAVAAAAMIMGLMAGAVSAATMPTFQSLPPISIYNSGSVRDLAHVAASDDGFIYVTEALRNRIAVMTQQGESVRIIDGIANPFGIAVNRNGVIFVSSLKNKSVVMMDRQGHRLGSLGKGDAEFARPVYVAIDPQNEDVYVTDQNANAIVVYSASGSLLRRIADTGNLPVAAVVRGDMLYVLDQPLGGAGQRQPRIAVFNKNTGSLVSSFGQFGAGAGQMMRPKSLSIDSAGRLFVVDYYHRVVYCYNASSGAYLGAVHNIDSNAVVMPAGVSVSKNGKLFVVSSGEDKLRVFGLDNYTSLSAAPGSLAFALTNNVSTPLAETISLANTGTAPLSYRILTETADGADWIQVSGAVGLLQANNGTALETIRIRGEGLNPGVYRGTVTIQDIDTGAQPAIVRLEKQIPLVLTVSNPEIQLSSNSLSFTGNLGDSLVLRKDLTVTLSGDTTSSVTWRASSSTGGTGSWLGISPSAQTGNSVVNSTITVNPAGMAAGVYNGTVTLTASGVSGAPATVQVTLTISSSGSISVATNRLNAVFKISGPNGVTLNGNGQSWAQAGMPNGAYTITYGAVEGSIAPKAETKTLAGTGALNFSGIYKEPVYIVAGSGVSLSGPSKIRIFDANYDIAGEIIPFGPDYTGDIPVAVGDVDGDGYDEIIAAYGADEPNPARIMIFRGDGTLLANADFYGLEASFGFGARVAAGDFDGDGRAEIVVGAGPGSENSAAVRIFSYDRGMVRDTGLYAVPFDSAYGLNVAAGDLDGDGIDELIVGPGPDPSAAAEVGIFKVNTSVAGSWALIDESAMYITPFTGSYGANVAAGDLDGDGKDEIIASTGLNALAQGSIIAALRGDGSAYGLPVASSEAGGIEICAGDLNEDGRAEIITAFGPAVQNSSTVKIYSKGALIRSFEAFINTAYGAKVAFGRLGY